MHTVQNHVLREKEPIETIGRRTRFEELLNRTKQVDTLSTWASHQPSFSKDAVSGFV